MSENTSKPAVPSGAPRWFQYTVRLPLMAALLIALFFATNGFGVVGLHYPRAFDNDPLRSPIRVLSVKNNIVELEDGRVLRINRSLVVEPLVELLKASDNLIDLEVTAPNELIIFVKKRGKICGTSWTRLVNISIFPDDIPVNSRESVAYASAINLPSGSNQQKELKDKK
jgi:hypothetical protein